MTDELLKAFILYTQSVETAAIEYTKSYYEWKNYWLNYYMNQGKDLYEPDYTIKSWLKNLKSAHSGSTI